MRRPRARRSGASRACLALAASASLLAAGCPGGDLLAPPTLEPLEVSLDAPWFRDRMGRVLILRGATYTLTETEAPVGNFGGAGERAIVEMERLGMNLVRLPLAWSQLEPRPGRFASHPFIERVDPVIRWAAAHGMVVVLSMRAWPLGGCDRPLATSAAPVPTPGVESDASASTPGAAESDAPAPAPGAGESDATAPAPGAAESDAPAPTSGAAGSDATAPAPVARDARPASDRSVPDWVCKIARRAARTPEKPVDRDPACAFWTARDPQGTTLLEHYLDTWSAVAQYYAGDPRVVGLDLIDEPSAAGCFEDGPFLNGVLTPYFRRLAAAARSFGYRNAFLFEPPVAPGAPLPAALRRLPAGFVYAPHLYGQRFGADAGAAAGATSSPLGGEAESAAPESLAGLYARAVAQAEKLRAPLLIGEYGASLPPDEDGYRGASEGFLRASLAELDRQRIGGAYYALRPRSRTDAGVELGRLASVLAHPYARRIAGIPSETGYDPATRVLRLRFADDPERSPPDPTEIFLPRALYAGGFVVDVKPAGRWTFDRHSQRLLVYRGGSDDGSYEVVVRPAQGSPPR